MIEKKAYGTPTFGSSLVNTRQLYFEKNSESSCINTDNSFIHLLGVYIKECVRKWKPAVAWRDTKKRWKGCGVKMTRKRIRKVVRSRKATEWPQLSTSNDSGTVVGKEKQTTAHFIVFICNTMSRRT